MHAAFLRFFLTALAALVVAAVACWCAGAQVRDVDDARDSSLMSEVIPMAATSLLVPAQCIVFDVDSVSAVLAPFASSIAFLFIGSWMFVTALQKHGQWGTRFCCSLAGSHSRQIFQIRLATTMACNFGFLVPVSTGPNAQAYATQQGCHDAQWHLAGNAVLATPGWPGVRWGRSRGNIRAQAWTKYLPSPRASSVLASSTHAKDQKVRCQALQIVRQGQVDPAHARLPSPAGRQEHEVQTPCLSRQARG